MSSQIGREAITICAFFALKFKIFMHCFHMFPQVCSICGLIFTFFTRIVLNFFMHLLDVVLQLEWNVTFKITLVTAKSFLNFILFLQVRMKQHQAILEEGVLDPTKTVLDDKL